jgi:hypothetical protein
MLGQLWEEPELELLELEPDEPELVLLDPVFELLELDGVVVEELVVPVLDVLVVAALATSAPPVTRPVVSAPIANTFRKRIFMGRYPFVSCDAPPPFGGGAHTLRLGPVAGRTATAECWFCFLTIA